MCNTNKKNVMMTWIKSDLVKLLNNYKTYEKVKIKNNSNFMMLTILFEILGI